MSRASSIAQARRYAKSKTPIDRGDGKIARSPTRTEKTAAKKLPPRGTPSGTKVGSLRSLAKAQEPTEPNTKGFLDTMAGHRKPVETLPWDEEAQVESPQTEALTPAPEAPTPSSNPPSRGKKTPPAVGDVDKTHPSIEGTRLETVLRHIEHNYDQKDPELRGIAKEARGGRTWSKKVGGLKGLFMMIRDKLLGLGSRGDKQADKLAREYNWGRVHKGLAADAAVKDFIHNQLNSKVKHTEKARAFHNLFGHGAENREYHNVERRSQILNALSKHVSKKTGYKLSTHEILNAVRRAGQAEENLHGGPAWAQSVGDRGLNPHTAELPPDIGHGPAYTKEGRGRFVPRKGIRAGQYARAQFSVIRYASPERSSIYGSETPPERGQDSLLHRISAGIRSKIRDTLRGKEQSQDSPFPGLHYHSHVEGKFSHPNFLAARLEHEALRHALRGHGKLPEKEMGETDAHYQARTNQEVGKWSNEIRQHLQNFPNDPLSKWYRHGAEKITSPGWGTTNEETEATHLPDVGIGPKELAQHISPFIRKFDSEGDNPHKTEFHPFEVEEPHDDEGRADHEQFRKSMGWLRDLMEPEGDKHTDFPISATPKEMETHAAMFLHARDALDRAKRSVHSPEPEEEGPIDLADTPDESESVSLPGKSKRVYGPRLLTNDVKQSIADHLASGKKSEDVLGMLREKHGMTGAQASRQFENYKKLKTKPTPATAPPSLPKSSNVAAPKNGVKRKKFAANEGLLAPGGNSTHVTESDFHRALEENPNEKTTQAGYADWLEENGRPGQASMERASANESHVPSTSRSLMYQKSSIPTAKYISMTHVSPHDYGHDGISLTYPSDTDSGLQHRFTAWIPHGSTKSILQSLGSEGFSLHPHTDPEHYHEVMNRPEPEPSRDHGFGLEDPNYNKHLSRAVSRARRYAQAAPAGDLIVGYNNYKGGQRIPSKNNNEFMKAMMNPPKFNPVRMAAARKKLKGKFPPVLQVHWGANDSTGVNS